MEQDVTFWIILQSILQSPNINQSCGQSDLTGNSQWNDKIIMLWLEVSTVHGPHYPISLRSQQPLTKWHKYFISDHRPSFIPDIRYSTNCVTTH